MNIYTECTLSMLENLYLVKLLRVYNLSVIEELSYLYIKYIRFPDI